MVSIRVWLPFLQKCDTGDLVLNGVNYVYFSVEFWHWWSYSIYSNIQFIAIVTIHNTLSIICRFKCMNL